MVTIRGYSRSRLAIANLNCRDHLELLDSKLTDLNGCWHDNAGSRTFPSSVIDLAGRTLCNNFANWQTISCQASSAGGGLAETARGVHSIRVSSSSRRSITLLPGISRARSTSSPRPDSKVSSPSGNGLNNFMSPSSRGKRSRWAAVSGGS